MSLNLFQKYNDKEKIKILLILYDQIQFQVQNLLKSKSKYNRQKY